MSEEIYLMFNDDGEAEIYDPDDYISMSQDDFKTIEKLLDKLQGTPLGRFVKDPEQLAMLLSKLDCEECPLGESMCSDCTSDLVEWLTTREG